MESFDQLLAGELDLAVRSREALPLIPPAGSTSRRLIEAAFLRAGLRLESAMEAGGWESMGW
jgi:hypothetical protein